MRGNGYVLSFCRAVQNMEASFGPGSFCFCLLVINYSHQSISDYSWEVYIVHSGVFAG